MKDDEILLTVFTPTYNRQTELSKLYSTLCKQTDMRFEWIIVDDGSTDSTKSTVKRWLGASQFSIRYYRQKNSGKHVAHNLGAQEAQGRLFMCVDSDDWLEAEAVATIVSDAESVSDEMGLIYPKLFANQHCVEKWFPEDVDAAELSDMRMRYGLVLETAIVFKTNVLRRHPFPVVVGERYMPEGSAYYDFHDPELFAVRKTPFYRCEYLEGGLTNNIWLNWINNPVGTRMSLKKRYHAARHYHTLLGLREQIAAIMGIEALNIAIGDPVLSYCPKHSPLARILIPCAFLLKERRFSKTSLMDNTYISD